MASKKTNGYASFIDSVNEFITIGRSKNVVHQFTEDEQFDGRNITLHGKKLLNFGSCSYMGLEMDGRIQESAIDAIRRYGSQFSSSRTYTSFTLYKELEEYLNVIFGGHVILSTSSSLGHRSVMPILIQDSDAVIIDHQAHISMQDAGKELSLRGVPIVLSRHNRIDELENKIKDLTKYEKIWYVFDGVYSMYGDLSPIHEIVALQKKYKNLYLYVDDAHGMSWAGKHGRGFILGEIELTERVVLCSSLAKGFASAGGIFVFSEYEQYVRIKNWGGPLTYSGPQQPAVIGASLASAKIHLSPEIYQRQNALTENVAYCNKIISELHIPIVSQSVAPIFFIGLGAPKVAYNMNERLIKDGLHVNLGIYPAVPETCTGIRFALTLHHTKEDIERLADRVKFHLPKVLEQEYKSMEDIYRAFNSMPNIKEQRRLYEKTYEHNGLLPKQIIPELTLEYYNSIDAISKEEWDLLFGEKGSFDFNALSLMETVFTDNHLAEENWDFHYYLVKDQNNHIILATLFTSMIAKDDMLSDEKVSVEIEKLRQTDKYYLTSKMMMMGTLLSDGEHLYLDKTNGAWKEAFRMLLEHVWMTQDTIKAATLLLRDFTEDQKDLMDFLFDQGFVKMNMEDRHVIDLKSLRNREAFIKSLTSKKRSQLNQDVLEYEKFFDLKILTNPADHEIENLYTLYENVKNRNLSINDFKLPKKLFYDISRSKDWEIITLKLNPENIETTLGIVSFVFANKKNNYCPVIIGLDYSMLDGYNIYKQMLFQLTLRAIELGKDKIYLGLTASVEKRKIGALALKNFAFVQIKDNFNYAVIEQLKSSVAKV